MKVSEVLREAAEVIETGWCREATAVDAQGEPTYVDDDSAVRWCPIGAICKVTLEDVSGHYYYRAIEELGLAIVEDEYVSVPDKVLAQAVAADDWEYVVAWWNDSSDDYMTGGDVSSMLRDAAKAAQRTSHIEPPLDANAPPT